MSFTREPHGPVKNIVFDFGRVLVDYDYPALLSKILPDPKERIEFYTIFCSSEFCDRFDKGDEPFMDIINDYRDRYPNWDRQIMEYHDRQIEVMTGEVPGMRSVLTRLHNRGYKLYGLTNWGETIYSVIEKFDILRMMDGRLISSEEHIIKPDPQIYRRLCDKFRLKIEECLFTDDKQTNVDGAISAGMDAVVFKNAEQFEEELKIRKIL